MGIFTVLHTSPRTSCVPTYAIQTLSHAFFSPGSEPACIPSTNQPLVLSLLVALPGLLYSGFSTYSYLYRRGVLNNLVTLEDQTGHSSLLHMLALLLPLPTLRSQASNLDALFYSVADCRTSHAFFDFLLLNRDCMPVIPSLTYQCEL